MDKLQEKLRLFRRELHQFPEISGEERKTAGRVQRFVEQFGPDEVIRCSESAGLIIIFKSENPGPTVMIRAELDGLAIPEINDISYKSVAEGKGHLCGHDGHMTIVAAVAAGLSQQRPRVGKVALMFQPAEETGEGADRMLHDPCFDQVKPDYIFALHNLPGFSKNEIVVKNGVFASASKGLIIELDGRTSHAAEPENGISPALATARLIQFVEKAPGEVVDLKDFALATVVHVRIGSETFGVTPGKGVLMCTLRAYRDDDLIKLETAVRHCVSSVAKDFNLKSSVAETEVFQSTINDDSCCNLVRKVANEHGLKVTEVEKPFRWSEDFGRFTQKFKGAMFGLGAGEDTPDLHNPNYDFPDDITGSGVLMFTKIIDSLLNRSDA